MFLFTPPFLCHGCKLFSYFHCTTVNWIALFLVRPLLVLVPSYFFFTYARHAFRSLKNLARKAHIKFLNLRKQSPSFVSIGWGESMGGWGGYHHRHQSQSRVHQSQSIADEDGEPRRHCIHCRDPTANKLTPIWSSLRRVLAQLWRYLCLLLTTMWAT